MRNTFYLLAQEALSLAQGRVPAISFITESGVKVRMTRTHLATWILQAECGDSVVVVEDVPAWEVDSVIAWACRKG